MIYTADGSFTDLWLTSDLRPPPQPPAAPTSRNYAEMREKLRLRLTKRKEEQPKREEQQPVVERDGGVEDHRRVEDLLQFINSADSKPTSSSKAAKRARHKQKKVGVVFFLSFARSTPRVSRVCF